MIAEDVLGKGFGRWNRQGGGDGALSATSFFAAQPDISLVVPLSDDEARIATFLSGVVPVLEAIDPRWEVVFVNDGSSDGTIRAIHAAHGRDARVRGIDLSRRFGREVALRAGLDHALGKAVVPIQVDLRDPPELIEAMVARWRQGYDIVSAGPDAGDFRLLDAKVVESLRRFGESEGDLSGIVASIGYKTCTIPARGAAPRREAAAGPARSRRSAVLAMVSTDARLKILIGMGGAAAIGALVYASTLFAKTVLSSEVTGSSWLIVFTLLFNGLTLMALGLQGAQIARLAAQGKAEPLYFVRETVGVAPPPAWIDDARH